MRCRGRRCLVTLGIVVAVVLFVGYAALQWFMRPILTEFAGDEGHFKYGSIGNDAATGIPAPIWFVLPQVCARHVPQPGGYEAFGLIWEPGRDPKSDAPVGFSKARVGVERMAINCAFCHTVRARQTQEGEPRLYFGGAGNAVDVQAYVRFLGRCAADRQFSARRLLPAMDERFHLSWVERLAYRFVLIPITRKRLLQQRDAFAWTNRRPDWGVGRIAPFNPVKFGMLGLLDDDTVDNSDMQAVWNLDGREKIRRNAPLHWDGLNTSIHEVVLSSALGDGTTAAEYRAQSLGRIERYLRTTRPPPSPHAPEASAVARGKTVYAAHCAACHAADGARTLSVVALAELGTDANRAIMWTDSAARAYNNYRVGRDWSFKAFRNVDGYIAEPLEGTWLNGPYLHNGSVPTLSDLLAPPEKRPVTFLRGVDVVDQVNGGFVSPRCDPKRPPARGFCFDTRLVGNSNGGHVYGTGLGDADKADLLAYLLTL